MTGTPNWQAHLRNAPSVAMSGIGTPSPPRSIDRLSGAAEKCSTGNVQPERCPSSIEGKNASPSDLADDSDELVSRWLTGQELGLSRWS